MSNTYSIKDVTRDLASLLHLTRIFKADEENFWSDVFTKERFVYSLDANDRGKEIALFQDPMPRGDIYFFNPYAEGFGKKNPATILFYKSIEVALNANILAVAMYVVDNIIAGKKIEAEGNTPSYDPTVTRIASTKIDRKTTLFDVIDDKLKEDFKKIADRVKSDLVHIPYLTQPMTAKLKCAALTKPEWDEQYGADLRKRSVAAFKTMLLGILNIEDESGLESFSVRYDPDMKTSAQLYTKLSVYLKVYARFNDLLAEAYSVNGVPQENAVINLGELHEVLERSSAAYAIAKHMVQTVIPTAPANSTETADSSNRLDFGRAQKPRFAGPEVVDTFGRRGPAPSQPLRFGSAPPAEGHSRFRPHVVEDAKIDPFAPLTRSNPVGGSFGSMMGNPGGGQFGQSSMAFGNTNPSLNLNAPINFGMPGMRRNY